MSDRGELARAMYRAYANGDRAALEVLIADEFRFSSPQDNLIDRSTYFERCWPNSERITDFAFVHVVEQGETVFVTYEGMSIEGRKFRNTEVLTFNGGKVTEVEVYFGWSLPHAAPPGGFIA
ncbi:nuclear transport factor 2 family protein [Pacificispira sp.]|uniref:nuclear transport factor 2 family protein n=1 Tax=Pacificispira sp. TaxID=2888761 RepID=UPI003BAA684C